MDNYKQDFTALMFKLVKNTGTILDPTMTMGVEKVCEQLYDYLTKFAFSDGEEYENVINEYFPSNHYILMELGKVNSGPKYQIAIFRLLFLTALLSINIFNVSDRSGTSASYL